MAGLVKNEFKISAMPGEELTRRLAYLAAQDSGSVLTGGFTKDSAGLGREGSDRSDGQTARAIEILTQQEQIRLQRAAELASRLDALELAARDALTDAENDLADILSNANRDRLGRAVFMDENGAFRNEDGDILDVKDIELTDLDPNAPAWEDLEDARNRIDAASSALDAASDIREQSHSDPLTDADLDSLFDNVEALENDLESSADPPDAEVNQSDEADQVMDGVAAGGMEPFKPF